MREKTSSGLVPGPILTPTGLWTPWRMATWAPSTSRVRSPTHRKWAEVSYRRPERESRRIMASSYSRSRASWAA